MVEQQVQVEVLLGHLQVDLASHEGETGSQFQQELGDVLDQAMLKVPLQGLRSLDQEIEDIGILQGLLGQVGLGVGQTVLEVRGLVHQGLALVEVRGDLHRQEVAPPSILERGLDVLGSRLRVLDLVQQQAEVRPRQFCSRLLQN